jgi:hypothetical protein
VNELTNKKAACARLVQQLDLGKVQNKYNHRAQRPVDAFLSEHGGLLQNGHHLQFQTTGSPHFVIRNLRIGTSRDRVIILLKKIKGFNCE